MPFDPEASRYRLYRLRFGVLRLLSETSKEGVGTALVQHIEDGDFVPQRDRFGLLDRPDPDAEGVWIVNPWT